MFGMQRSVGGSFVMASFKSYDLGEDEYFGYDYSLCVRLAAVRTVILYRFVQELTGLILPSAGAETEKQLRATVALNNEAQWKGGGQEDMAAVKLDVMTLRVEGLGLRVGGEGVVVGHEFVEEASGLQDSYLRLLVRLCHLYETSAGIKSARDGATSEQILAEQRLQVLQRQLLLDLKDVATRRMRVRLLWALCEHLNLDGLNPLLADDPTDPVNILIFNLHELLFNVDSGTALVTNLLQDVQALLLCAQHLGARSARAASLLVLDLENCRGSSLADTVNKNQCRLVVNVLKYIQEKPLSRWTGWVRGTGEYPFGHQKLSVQYNEPASAQDRKLESLVKTAVQKLWRPAPSELALAVTGGRTLRPVSQAKTLSGSSDPRFLEASHLADVNERKLTLNLKIVNVTELQLPQVDVRVRLDGAVNFLNKSPQALRQLKDLASQDPILVDVTVTVSKFERYTLNVQLLYYPGGGEPPAASALDSTPLNEYGDVLPRSRRGSVSSSALVGRGEPVVLRCKPYRVPLTELLLPVESAPVDFFRLWPTLPAMADFTCAYEYDPTDKDLLASGAGLAPFMSGLAALAGKPLARVCSHSIRTTQGFQVIAVRPLRDVLKQVPTIDITVAVDKLKARMASSEYQVISRVALTNLGEELHLPPKLRNTEEESPAPGGHQNTGEPGPQSEIVAASDTGEAEIVREVEEKLEEVEGGVGTGGETEGGEQKGQAWASVRVTVDVGTVEAELYTSDTRETSLALVQSKPPVQKSHRMRRFDSTRRVPDPLRSLQSCTKTRYTHHS